MNKINISEDFVPIGFTNGARNKFSSGGNNYIRTGYDMKPISTGVAKLVESLKKCAEEYENNNNPDHTRDSYIEEAKQFIINEIDTSCSKKVNEASYKQYQFNPGYAYNTLKKREAENIKRFRAAQERGDEYAVAKYKLRIKIDKLDMRKIKLLSDIHNLNKKYKKYSSK